MDLTGETKIWRYMDLGKLVCLLSDEALYFACLADLVTDDPYEAVYPKSHLEAVERMLQEHLDTLASLRAAIPLEGQDTLNKGIANLVETVKSAPLTVARGFGVSCWHQNDDESAAMWRLYSDSGKGIAIESTVKKLRCSLGDTKGLIFDQVRYIDFHEDPIEKGHRHYSGFQKRNSFAHEREFRATIRLKQDGEGVSVPCDLQELITAIWVSPRAPSYMICAVQALCAGSVKPILKPVLASQLLSAPEYGFQFQVHR